MKILITILLTIFLSSTASAQSFKSICSLAKLDINLIQTRIKLSLATMNDAVPDSYTFKYGKKNYEEAKREQLESAQLYHYLDCKEVLKGDG